KKQKRLFKEGIGIYFMENMVELLEIVISYVSNTMSFIRIIAFGLAHAGLFIAIFSLLDILKRSGTPGIINILVLILGNIGIIFLEGLVVSIQAMRLEYYEFFGKFFEKTGIKYQPVKM
ncbi:MAG: V-type ATP synthase subunit I, partial [Spirochaetes bacterium]|nr:V-type ATP synthase subunit I [Spirochaetota bacterium]